MYSKPPPEDEQFIYSKQVEDIYWNKFRKKVHLVGSYYAKMFTFDLPFCGLDKHQTDKNLITQTLQIPHAYTFLCNVKSDVMF